MKPRVLVTGASGLIGRGIVERLHSDAEPVVLMRGLAAAPANVEAIAADLEDSNFVKRLPAKIDAVIHLAQADGYADPDRVQTVFRVNVEAVASLLRWAQDAGASHFIHASTGGLYGRGNSPFGEESPIRLEGPLAFYCGTKRAAELLGMAYQGRFTVAALRFFFVYGPGQKETMLMPRLVRSVAEGRPVTLAGERGMRLNPIHVDDAAAAAVAALRLNRSAAINIAGPEVLSIRDVAEMAGQALNKQLVFERSGEPEGNDLIADISRMRELLHSPAIGFRAGVADMVAEYRSERADR